MDKKFIISDELYEKWLFSFEQNFLSWTKMILSRTIFILSWTKIILSEQMYRALEKFYSKSYNHLDSNLDESKIEKSDQRGTLPSETTWPFHSNLDECHHITTTKLSNNLCRGGNTGYFVNQQNKRWILHSFFPFGLMSVTLFHGG